MAYDNNTKAGEKVNNNAAQANGSISGAGAGTVAS